MELHKESQNHLRLGLCEYHHVCKAVVHHPDLLKKPRNDVLASHPMFSTHRRSFNCTILPSTYETHRKFPPHSIVELETLTRTTLTLLLQKPISIHPWPKCRSFYHRQLTLLWATYASCAILMHWESCLFVAVEAAVTQPRNAEKIRNPDCTISARFGPKLYSRFECVSSSARNQISWNKIATCRHHSETKLMK